MAQDHKDEGEGAWDTVDAEPELKALEKPILSFAFDIS